MSWQTVWLVDIQSPSHQLTRQLEPLQLPPASKALLQVLATQAIQQQQHATMITCWGGQNQALVLGQSHPHQMPLQSLCHLPCSGLARQPRTQSAALLD